MSQQPPHSPARHRLAWPVLALVAALVGVGAGIAIGLLVAGDGYGGDRDERNAAMACSLLADIDREDPFDDDAPMEDPTTWEISAIASLANAAATDGRRYRSLAEAADLAWRHLQTRNIEELPTALDDVADECESRDLAID
ncbi:hypothetical protein ACOACO_16850 [Nocardioides sp. CPCC 205120]|uniref:hypothetical protein n=1 Tax=Nocardioides sp. CPCC 205120 TaxID=3406462 RepID=UPI003B50D3F1